jgi:CRISPR-associated protein Csb1
MGKPFGGETMSTWNELADKMLAADGPAALVCRQWLMPAEGRDAVIFPPTFAAPEGGGRAGYNIDEVRDANDPNKVIRIAIIDTVGSQANRMEPLFKKANGEDTSYSRLVPQIEIKAGNKIVNLLDAGHRAADAIVRYSTLGAALREAFDVYQQTGDATQLARIAPTSVVFGAWDSRDTQAKLPRLVASTIRAYDVAELKRSAQYNPPIDYIGLGLIEGADDKKVLDAASELGFRHAPAGGTHGGVIVHGEIRREAILSLVGLRAVGPKGASGNPLRRYLLGLALVAMMHEREHNLRQGCLLVQDPEKKPLWELVMHDGARPSLSPDGKAALAFAEETARAFGVGQSRTVEFDIKAANEALKQQVGGKGARGKRGG